MQYIGSTHREEAGAISKGCVAKGCSLHCRLCGELVLCLLDYILRLREVVR